MKYLARKHEDGLAIIHWCLDEDYPHREDEDTGVDYMIFVDIYDSHGNLIDEDGIGGIQINAPENFSSIDSSNAFEKEIIEAYEYHFKSQLTN